MYPRNVGDYWEGNAMSRGCEIEIKISASRYSNFYESRAIVIIITRHFEDYY